MATENNSSTYKKYTDQINQYKQQQNDLDASKTTYDAEKNALNSKIDNSKSLLDNYVSTVNNTQSAKAQAYVAQQNAIKQSNLALKASGLGNTGLSESTSSNIYNNYVSALNNATATQNDTETNAYKSYIDANNLVDNNKSSQIDTIRGTNYETLIAELETNSENGLSGKTSDDYLAKAQSMYENGELSLQQLNQVKTVAEGYKNSEVATKYNITNTNPVNPSDFIGTWSNKNKQRDQDRLLQKLANATANGTLEKYGVTNGSVLDFNYGKGDNCYVYYNGNWYATANTAHATSGTVKLEDFDTEK